jgi:hypothetical protein
MAREFVVQCGSVLMLEREDYDGEEEELIFTTLSVQCRREKNHEDNHSTNAFADGTAASSTEGPVVFRLDWRTNDGIVYTRYPKKGGKG